MFLGVGKAIEGLHEDIARLEDEIRAKREEIDRLVGLEEAAIRAMSDLTSAVKDLRTVDGESVREIEEAVSRIFDNKHGRKNDAAPTSEEEAPVLKGEERKAEILPTPERNVQELSPSASYDHTPAAERVAKKGVAGITPRTIAVGDVVENGMGVEFTVTSVHEGVVELVDSKKKTMKYPASALSVVRGQKAS